MSQMVFTVSMTNFGLISSNRYSDRAAQNYAFRCLEPSALWILQRIVYIVNVFYGVWRDRNKNNITIFVRAAH